MSYTVQIGWKRRRSWRGCDVRFRKGREREVPNSKDSAINDEVPYTE